MKTNEAHTCKCDTNGCSLSVSNLSVSLNRFSILEDISFDVQCGEITAVIGPNGAGKTTLLRVMMGLVPFRGCVHFCKHEKHGGGKPRIGYMPQKLDFDRSTPLTVAEFFAMSYGARPVFMSMSGKVRDRAATALEKVDASQLIDKRLGSLSGGELQRVLFAVATDPMPHLLIMDEPVAGIDVGGETLIYELIKNLRGNMELSVIIVSHDLSMVSRQSDHVICINRTLICEGTAKDILTPEMIEKTFGSYVGIFHHHGPHTHG